MGRKKKNVLLLLLFILLIFSLIFIYRGLSFSNEFREQTKKVKHPLFSYAKVVKVIDGDTIILDNGKHLRYIGIDTPEIDWKDNRKSECYSWKAREENSKLVLHKRVRLEKDISDTDKYGRLLRYVYVRNLFVNEFLVKEGYARVMTLLPDVKYQDLFLKAEMYAKSQHKGLWNKDICR